MSAHIGQAPGSRLLITSLADFVAETVKDYPFPAPSGAIQPCRVFIHGLPEELEDEVYPYVAVRWVEGDITSEPTGQTILKDTVALILGVFAPRSQTEAGLLCAELLDCLRRSLWRQRILARRFELEEPLRASAPGLQQKVHKYHAATLETVWNYTWPPKALDDPKISRICGA